jgi:hypothetical protein
MRGCMEKNELESPIIRRARERSPNYYCLVKIRNISDDDVFHYPKWEIMRSWYRNLEARDHQWLDLALQSISNAVVNQERIYFAVTRKTLRELLRSDKNWRSEKGIGMKNSYYELLLQDMVDSKMFEPYAENERLRELKKPRIFRVVDKTLLSLMNAVPEDVQLRELIDFIDKNDQLRDDPESDENQGDNVGDTQGDNVGDVELRTKNLELSNQENSLPAVDLDENQSVEFEDLLLTQVTQFPRFNDIPSIADLTVGSCHGFTLDRTTLRKFENHLVGFLKGKTTSKQKKLVEDLVKKFENEVKQILAKAKVDKSKLKLATRTNAKFEPASDKDDLEDENNTLKVLNNFFGKENIKILKSKLEQVQNEQEKFEIQKEIEFWESVV